MRRNIFIAVGLAVLAVGSCKKQIEYVPEKYELSIVDAESGLSGESRTLYVDSEGGVKSVVVRSNVDITCKILDSDWILVADEGDARALTDNVFSFRILENDSNFDRKGKVLFFNDYYEVADTLRLVQRGHEGLMMIEYSGSCFDALCLEGAGAYALIDWGDSSSGLFGPAVASSFSRSADASGFSRPASTSGFSRPASTSASGRTLDAGLFGPAVASSFSRPASTSDSDRASDAGPFSFDGGSASGRASDADLFSLDGGSASGRASDAGQASASNSDGSLFASKSTDEPIRSSASAGAPLYKVPAHQYTAPGPKTIEVKSHNCTALTITNITGISSLDFSSL